MNFKEQFDAEYGFAQDVVRRLAVIEEKGYQSIVMEAMNYSILAGGKRLRPIFMHSVFSALNGDENRMPEVECFMAAIELIHTYSLVHDDLPAMDNDELRRGKPTTHVKYGEDMAILAGDALLNRAFETASKAFGFCKSEEDLKCTGAAFSILSGKAGIYGMVGGQVYDVLAEKKNLELDEEKLLFIFRLKTAALIEASMMIGAVLAGASEETVSAVRKIAEKIGIAFQIRDDLLDVYGSEEELGKPVGSDERNNKTTYVTLKGIEQSEKDVQAYSDEALRSVAVLFGEEGFLYSLSKSLVGRRS
ncbi:MAG: polyprenyl synthetase family protein [Lachnospiraceae bacterium]|nr:polyprenyl synthetase family protein [Lachnospiraceae bacterium]